MARGTLDNLDYHGMTWNDIREAIVLAIGDISALTGTRTVVAMFEFANLRTNEATGTISQAQAKINVVLALGSTTDVVFGTSTDDGSFTGVSSRARCLVPAIDGAGLR